jgi:hypothetical protein
MTITLDCSVRMPIDDSYVSRMVYLTTLDTDITAEILV